MNGWNFNNCYDKDSYECLTSTQADKIISALIVKGEFSNIKETQSVIYL
jgi:hypothetical protein